MSVMRNKDIVEIALKICCDNEFKIEIFSTAYSDHIKPIDCKEEWDEMVENRALNFLRAYNVEENQQESVIGAVFSIALRMLVWIEYHVGTFNFPREFCVEFLEPSLFTPEGIIDSQKVATNITEITFSNLQDFQLASYYCQMERIPELFQNLSEKDKKLVYDANNPHLIFQPDIIKFWSYYYMGDIDKLQEEDVKIDQYRLKTAIASGSQVAVEYCLRIMSLKTKQSNLVDTAVSIITLRMQRELKAKEPNSNFVNDSVVFRSRNYSCKTDLWTPDYFLSDIFHSLLSRMSVSEKFDMLRKLFITIKFDTLNLKNKYIKVLDLFLCWPYQDQFLELMKLSWKHLPKRAFGGLLLEIVNRIAPEMGYFWYGEGKICNYRKLLMDIWTASPASFKRYVFSDKKRSFQNKDDPQGNVIIKEGKELLLRMFHLNNFSESDRRTAMSIIESAIQDERRDFLLSSEGAMVCVRLIESGMLDFFEELISICLKSSESVRKFRKKFCFLKAKYDFLEFVKDEKWNEAEETLKWGELTEEETIALKKEMIFCKDGKQTCRELCLTKSSAADYFVHWCLPSADSIKKFKQSLLYDEEGMRMCQNFLNNDVTALADKLINWCLSSQDDINEFKMSFALKTKISLNSNLEGMGKWSVKDFPNRIIDWKSLKTLLLWCFKSESDENCFKRKLLENSRENIILKCIELDRWDVADLFISWLDLSTDEEKRMKK
ncbi:uncharacterized protein [Parasteatoda tepidariorum]|uniref:uncharacterized protein n=1 Tax=Parasteatoda tepidariorum TaxID=114398 RepID=UPI001C71F3FD|nr:uncharacterized protein LOC107444518 [Parasteatoda tepidariorum]XP_042905893.1 uncharacterized protein LOC107444518 [Parasteatoda tepidariorum]